MCKIAKQQVFHIPLRFWSLYRFFWASPSSPKDSTSNTPILFLRPSNLSVTKIFQSYLPIQPNHIWSNRPKSASITARSSTTIADQAVAKCLPQRLMKSNGQKNLQIGNWNSYKLNMVDYLTRDETRSACAEDMWMFKPHLRLKVLPQCWQFTCKEWFGICY